MANASLAFPRETVEFLPLSVTDGTTALTVYQTAILPYRIRPVTGSWVNSVTVAGEHGLMINGLAPGTYGIWIRISSSPETIVISPADPSGPGYIVIT